MHDRLNNQKHKDKYYIHGESGVRVRSYLMMLRVIEAMQTKDGLTCPAALKAVNRDLGRDAPRASQGPGRKAAPQAIAMTGDEKAAYAKALKVREAEMRRSRIVDSHRRNMGRLIDQLCRMGPK